MNALPGFLHKILPDTFKDSINFGLHRRSYSQFRLLLFLVMIAIAMGPVIMTAGLGYYNYKDLLQKEERGQLEARLTGSSHAIEALIDSLKSVVVFVARKNRYVELTTGKNLEELFARIKRQYEYFADLGVINQSGIQQTYWGPYDLEGTDYSKEEWFKEVIDKGVYISHVYTGYRHVPHFAIAVANHDPTTKKTWVLRATIDAVTLQNFVNTIKTNASDDLFLVDDAGYLQTSSENYGQNLTQLVADIKPGLQQGVSKEGENIFYAKGKIKNTPWSVILVEKRYVHHQDWVTFRSRLLIIVIACLVINLLVVYGLVTMLTNLIRKADEMQLTMLQEAEHTDKLASIGRLAAGVGHEINNPLAIINQKTGLAEDLILISPDFEHKKAIEGCLKVIDQSVERCKAITHRLLGFARRADVHDEVLQVNDVIKEVMQFLENSLMHSRIRLELQLQEDLPLITSDHLQLQQIFLNIINNAIDAIGKDGLVNIMTHLVAGEVRVVIQDNGSGIDSEILPHIFEPFFTTKETGKGTGLGLSITYGLVKKLGGDITVRSHVGQGTAFTITLPIHSEEHDNN
ncbi:two-component sensor histidine kinase [Desulfopila sp. IMCC35006]|uniref:sensor histidine kinase n=1 Tax=Desulfopila sp. IMCC35006 TaxID=2569542 RepID=UPI0010AD9AF3|nr:PAS domain-containing sensor histidine kinase [Desulfopila sp. IMCC35006]TKB27521.1 two-component sensor histidine kinase [Desulfopila sp. IMCC35006]